MKAIILNSGMGTRLEELTENNPKSLIKIGFDDTILSRAIKILEKFNISEFIITTGYLNNVLERYIKGNFSNLDFKFIHNPVYHKTNYIKSLSYLPKINDDIILLHGDLVFSSEVAKNMICSKESSVVIDSTIELPKDDFKAKIENNLVKYIGIDYFEDDSVACQPFYKLKSDDWILWKNKIDEFCNEGNDNVYAENALNMLFNKINLNPLDICGDLCMEIDTKKDLNKVKSILNTN